MQKGRQGPSDFPSCTRVCLFFLAVFRAGGIARETRSLTVSGAGSLESLKRINQPELQLSNRAHFCPANPCLLQVGGAAHDDVSGFRFLLKNRGSNNQT